MAYIGNPIYQSAFVTDQFSGTGSQTAYTMSVAPAGTTNVLIAVSGVLQDPSTYGVVGNTLNFTTAPPSGTANISVRYLGIPVTGVTTTAYRTKTEFTATAGQTTFTPPSYTVGYIDVFRNGVLLGSADYTASNGTTVVLTTGATSGDLITTESFYVSSVLNAIPNTAGSVGTANIAGGAVGSAQLGSLTTLPVSGGYTATLPSATGTVMVSGNMPAFIAYSTATQTFSSGTWTKAQFNNKLYDTNSNFDATTNYRFTPTVAGYYQINSIFPITTGMNYAQIAIYKNGSAYKSLYTYQTQGYSIQISDIVYFNGSTDYIEIYINPSATSTNNSATQTTSSFSGCLVRTA